VAGEVAVIPGTTYTGLVAARPVTVERDFRALIRWFDDDDILLSTSTGSTETEIEDEWVLALVTVEAPADAATAAVAIEVFAVDAGEQHNVDTFGIVDYETTDWEPADAPAVSFNYLWRRDLGDTGVGIRLADPATGLPVQIVANGAWTDWFLAPGQLVEYRLEAVADSGTSRLGDWTA
jgi:hypothetical protein